ncbi:hypothetical protein CA850_29745 [Micromonospora echinospora]|uniref:Uncharacterized protein n=1 Tax=Micromonospora echinospora TaxID=1877 RepID=A0A1C5AAX0_MICEC|nr:hypothetical protein [Micromonospora echinospora]OZV74763.1 hypothetical protein CA850_29745 [Micromonospora echinospora]SCF42378.1 hypothetical protein GA0070618_6651 [Micromonospora echinospora]
MAQESPLSATGALTEAQYERLAAPQCADGLIGHPNDPSPVALSGSQVVIKAGSNGILRGFPWSSGPVDTTHTVSLSGAARSDLVVLRLDRNTGYALGTAIRTGSPGAGAPAPATGTGPADVYELPLAEYDVANGAFGALRRRCWYLGDDGQILCKADTRPPHAPGRRIREVDTGRTYESTGATWAVILDDSGSTTLPLSGMFTSARNTLYRRNGFAHLGLTINRPGGDLAARTTYTVGTIPAGYRPEVAFDFIALSPAPALATGTVQASGGITIRPSERIEAGSNIVIGPLFWPVA